MRSIRSSLRIVFNCLVLASACAQQIQCPAMCICTGRRAVCDHVIEYDSILGPFPDMVVEVKISNSQVKTLGPSITGRNVETVVVDQCGFTVVTSNTFTDLNKLRSLHILNSEIGHVNYMAFRNISSSADILITHTSIESIKEHAFNDCSNLQQIKFEHLLLTTMNSKAISNIQVNSIIFDNVDIELLKRNFLSAIPDVKEVTIRGSTFRTIEPDAFSGLAAVDRVLIRNSSFVEVQSAAIMYLHKVSRLSFLFESSNVSCSCRSRDLFAYVHFFPGSVAPSVQCKSEESREFEGPLNRIDFQRLCSISGNIAMPSFATPKPSQITQGQVAAPTTVSTIRPSCPAVCRCSQFTAECSHGNTSLTGPLPDDIINVTISHMYLSSLGPDIIGASTENFRLIKSEIKEISPSAFSGSKNLKTIHISEVRIHSIKSCAFQNIFSGASIVITKTRIDVIHSGAFSNLRNLRSFELSQSAITYIESYAFSSVQGGKLSFYDMDISSLAPASFYSLHDVEFLSLYRLTLHNISKGAFMNSSKLNSVSLDMIRIHNMACLAVMDLRLATPGSHDNFVMTNINITCECSNTDFIKYVQDHPNSASDSVFCYSNETYKFDRPIREINYQGLCFQSSAPSCDVDLPEVPTCLASGQQLNASQPSAISNLIVWLISAIAYQLARLAS